jgi:hypothetical protein
MDLVLVATGGSAAETSSYAKLSIFVAGQLLLVSTLSTVLLPEAHALRQQWGTLIRICMTMGIVMATASIAIVGYLAVDHALSAALPLYVIMIPAIVLTSITAPLSSPLFAIRSGILLTMINLVEFAVLLLVWGSSSHAAGAATSMVVARSISIYAGSALTLVAVAAVARGRKGGVRA